VLTGGRGESPGSPATAHDRTTWEVPHMKLVRKIVIGFGSIAALMLAGGAHFKVN
jgi:hypothetical protein